MDSVEHIHELMRSGKVFLLADEAAPLLGCSANGLRTAAKQDGLGSLQYTFAGNKLLISTASVLNFLTGEPTR